MWTDVDQMAEALGITKSINDYGDCFDGMLECQNRRFHIYVNNRGRRIGSEYPRTRFTLAHELGHYAIAEHRNALLRGLAPHQSLCDQPNPSAYVELEADYFASQLLTPPELFEEELGNRGNSLVDVIDLANAFKASIQSTAKRIAESSDEQVAVAFWHLDGKFHWHRISPGLRKLGFTGLHDKSNSLEPGSATHQAMQDEGDGQKEIKSSATVAYRWFFGAGERDMLFREEAIKTPYYVMTWLIPSYSFVGAAR